MGKCDVDLNPLTLATDDRYDFVDIAQGRNVAAAREMVTGRKLAPQKTGQGVTILVPDFPAMAVVEINTEP